jgi:DNA-binding XRE family transcriptional regulator
LEVRGSTPVEELPLAAIQDILERGDLGDWQPIAVAIRRDPLGRLAEDVRRLVDAYPAYGTSPLWRSWIERCRLRAESRRDPRSVTGLAGLRHHFGLTQADLAARVGTSQSDLSKLERRRDVRLSSLATYLEALGGRLRLLFVSRTEQVEIHWPDR